MKVASLVLLMVATSHPSAWAEQVVPDTRASLLAEIEDKQLDPHADTLMTSPSMTLREVIDAAYARSPKLQVLSAQRDRADALMAQARSLWAADPAIAVRHQTDLIGINDGLREWEAGLELPLWWPGQRMAREEAAKLAAEEADAGAAAQRYMVAGIVREVLWDQALRKNELALALRDKESVTKIEDSITKRVAAGDLAHSDIVLARQDVDCAGGRTDSGPARISAQSASIPIAEGIDCTAGRLLRGGSGDDRP